jgi:hypothetical protein
MCAIVGPEPDDVDATRVREQSPLRPVAQQQQATKFSARRAAARLEGHFSYRTTQQVYD